MKIDVGGFSLNCKIEGPADAPCITLSHALANDLTLWDDQAKLLRDRYRVLRYDQRGHGGSDAPPGPYGFDMLMADVIALWDRLEIERSHWMGLSIGGMMGYGLAQDHGDRMLSLIACDSRPDAPPDYQDYFQSRIDTAREKGMEGLVEPTVERWFTPETLARNPPVLDRVRNMIRATDPIGHEGCCEALKTLAFGARLAEIAIPTMIIGGAADKGAPPDVLEQTSRSIPGATHVVIESAGHISNLENPPAFNRAMEDFLAAL